MLTSIYFALSASIIAAATPCWSIPATAMVDEPEYKTVISVQFDDHGKASNILPVSIDPETAAAKAAANSFAQAVHRCVEMPEFAGQTIQINVPPLSIMIRPKPESFK